MTDMRRGGAVGRAIGVLAAGAITLSGCGSGAAPAEDSVSNSATTPDTSSNSADSGESATKPALDACSLLTSAEVTRAVGGTATTPSHNYDGCIWDDASNQPRLRITYLPREGHAVEMILTNPEYAPRGGRRLDIGDGAMQNPKDNLVEIKVGDDYLSVVPLSDPPLPADVVVDLAKIAYSRAH